MVSTFVELFSLLLYIVFRKNVPYFCIIYISS